MLTVLLAGLIGVAGTVLGAVLNEFIRRRNRIESYSTKVFERRLSAYEGLYDRIQESYGIASDVMGNSSYSAGERHDLISAAVHNIAGFTDKNSLYLNDEVTAHCVAAFMGAEDVLAAAEGAEREELHRHVIDMYTEGCRMIQEASGVKEIDRLFKNIVKPVLSGPVIEALRYYRAHPEQIGKLRGETPPDAH
jgi:hypothetical protein